MAHLIKACPLNALQFEKRHGYNIFTINIKHLFA